jgi:hypothetical protein
MSPHLSCQAVVHSNSGLRYSHKHRTNRTGLAPTSPPVVPLDGFDGGPRTVAR